VVASLTDPRRTASMLGYHATASSSAAGPKDLMAFQAPNCGFRMAKAIDSTGLLVGAVRIEIASPNDES
jgi:hypothetical protein